MSFARCAVLVAALALAGCAASSQRQASTVGERLRLAGEQQKACYDGLLSDPTAARVVDYMVLDAGDADRARKVKDRRTVNDQMRRDLLQLRQRTTECRAVSTSRFGDVDPAYVQVLAVTHEAEDDILLAMLNKRIRIGEANRRFLEVDALSDAAWDATTGSVVERPGDTPTAQALRREVAAAALRRLSDERQELGRLNGSADGACRLSGNVIDCGSS